MAKALPIVLGAAAIIVTGGAAAGLIGAVTAAYIGLGIGVVGTLANAILAEGPAKPQMADGDVSVAQAIPPRVRVYGRQRRSGSFLFYDSTPDGDLKILYQLAAHECDGFEEDWLNDGRVQLDEDGNVTDDPYWQEDNDDSAVVIQHYLGAPTQVIPSFDEKWTADHKGHGLCCAYVKYADLKAEEQANTYGGSAPPYRAVLRGAKIFDPRPAAGQTAGAEAGYTWSDNSALVVLDYLTRMEQGVPVGFGISFDRIDLASFMAAADVCDQEIPKKDGGVEKRWRTWGSYELTEECKSVLADLLDACCGRLIQGPDGRLGLTVGADRYRALAEDAYTVPPGIPASSVTLNDDQILEYDFSTGKAAIERINEVRAIYVSQAWEWAETEAGIQEDVASQARNGVESSQIKLRFVPSEGQAQRTARYTLRHGSPKRSGRIRTTLAGLDAWGERWITLTIGEIVGFTNLLCEINAMRVDRVSMTVEMEVTSYDDWWTWTAATDEADPAVPPPDTDEDNDVPVPENVAVSIVHRLVNGQTYVAIGLIAWDPPPRSVYAAKARYRVVQPDPEADPFPWQPLPVAQDDQQVETFPLEDGTAYEAQVRFIGPAGAGGDWSDLVPFTAVADPVAPASPTGLTAQANTPGTGQVTVGATQPNDPRAATLRFYRNSTNTFVGATLLSGMPLYAGPGQARSVVETPGAGDWWYFATSSNWSGVPSDPTAGVLAEVSPVAPVITSPSGPISTYDKRPPVSGNGASAGASIKLYANAVQVGTGTADGSGNWSVTPSGDLGTGANSMTATQTVGGNESVASGSVTITVDALDSDAATYIAAMSVTPTSLRQALLSTLFAGLKTDGVWSLLDGLYLMAAHDEQAGRINAKTPASVATATGSPTFTTDRGFEGNNSSDIDTLFNPSTAGGSYSQNSGLLAVYGTSSVAGNAQPPVALGTGGATAQAYINPRGATDQQAGRCNDTSGLANANTDTIGLFSVRRSAASGAGAKQLDEEGVQVASATTASAAVVNATFRILHGTGSAVSPVRVGAVVFGGYLDDTKTLALRNRLHTYLQAIGAVP